MADDGISFLGLDDFKMRITEAAGEYPLEAQKHLEKAGNRLKKMLKDASPDSGRNDKHKIKDSWKKEVHSLNAAEMYCEVWNTSPHHHLVNNGHAIVAPYTNAVKGFTQGQHYTEQTADLYEQTEAPKELEKLFDEITKKLK